MIMKGDTRNCGIIDIFPVNALFAVYGRIILYRRKRAGPWQHALYAANSSTQESIRGVPFETLEVVFKTIVAESQTDP